MVVDAGPSSAASVASDPLRGFGGLIGNVVGGLFGSSSAKKANKEAKKMMREQMAWQERMANTVHQRGVADLRAAGLNPILSATKGLSGAMPGNVSAAPVLNEGAAGQSSALAIQRAMAELDLLKAQTKNVDAQTHTELQKPSNVAADTGLKSQQNNLAAIQQTLTAANINLTKTENAIKEWQEIAEKMKTTFFLPEQYKQLQAQRQIVEEERIAEGRSLNNDCAPAMMFWWT